MVQINWTNAALDELALIRDYSMGIAPAYAERLIERLLARTDLLRTFLLAGRMVPTYPNIFVRELAEGDYRIIYEIISPTRADITHIYPAARPLPTG
ncbi:MAG: type II toxin-antitoxin system RelE/ParE family toxin [Janthinobacterium lividum]